MKIQFLLPRASEAKVKYDEKTGVLTIEPVFNRSTSLCTLSRIIVEGAKGAQKRFFLTISGRSGDINSPAAKIVEAMFDQQEAAAGAGEDSQ